MRTQAAVLAAVVTLSSGAAAREPWPVRDAAGTEAWDHTSGVCSTTFVDISSSGTVVALTPSGAAPADDDGGAVVGLASPFELYGRSHTSLVVSTNGYLAATDALARDGGGDFSNDCPLPAIPEPGPGVAARLAVLHDDLEAAPGGVILHQHFTTCPRPSEAFGAEPCTVIQWHDWSLRGQPTVFDFEAVLYHTSSQVAVVYGAGIAASAATVGLQNDRADTGLSIGSCVASGVASGPTAVCLFERRFPVTGPSAELELQLDGEPESLNAGGSAEWTVTVVNHGPTPVAGAAVTVTPTTGLDCSWTCEADAPDVCDAGPFDEPLVDAAVQLGTGRDVVYVVDCTAAGDASGPQGLDITVSPPTAVPDPGLLTNTASSRVEVSGSISIFADDFETGNVDAWSGTSH